MATARPLREVFGDLAGGQSAAADPAELLAAHGHADLSEDLVAEAVVNFADTAPVEVAEHLAPFVRAHSGMLPPDEALAAGDWLSLLATAPTEADTWEPEVAEVSEVSEVSPAEEPVEDPFDLDFGGGATDPGTATAADEADEPLDGHETPDEPLWFARETPAFDESPAPDELPAPDASPAIDEAAADADRAAGLDELDG
jgi:hypothetical protein